MHCTISKKRHKLFVLSLKTLVSILLHMIDQQFDIGVLSSLLLTLHLHAQKLCLPNLSIPCLSVHKISNIETERKYFSSPNFRFFR